MMIVEETPLTRQLVDILKQAEALSAPECAELIRRLTELSRRRSADPGLTWHGLRGLVRGPLVAEDAQAWVSRTRAESDSRRASGRKK